MKPEEFLQKFRYRIEITDSYRGVPWEYKYWLSSLTEGLDYGCDFEGERCSRYKKDEQPARSHCCSTCQVYAGNLNYLPNNEFILHEIADKFDSEFGFYRKGIGCILPRKYRSNLCLGLCQHLAHNHRLDTRGLSILSTLRWIEKAWEKFGWGIKFEKPLYTMYVGDRFVKGSGTVYRLS